ncbi:MAG TPA: winged helix-turn-helix domain-containing protein [Pyrinomonadaceae bacterium]|nr:winged helix-turn-helix domain-containing protein [Pyrinomonadaceae bacterium]
MSQNNHSLHLFEFGPFSLNVRERLLLRGEESISLSPKVFDTLVVLVENAGHVLTKDDLLNKLWPDSFVEESSLTQNISILRKALGEETTNPRYIETIPKRGYRFIADVKERNDGGTSLPFQDSGSEAVEVEEEKDSAPPESQNLVVATREQEPPAEIHTPTQRRRWKLYAAVAVLCLAAMAVITYVRVKSLRRTESAGGIKSIAVLPFKTIGIEDEKDVLGLGMADAIIIRLSKFQNLSTLPTSTIYKYVDNRRDVLAIGRDLGVDAVLDGTVQLSEGRVRVTAQLIHLSDGKTLWAGKFDEEYGNIFVVQDSISEKLAETLVLQISDSDKGRASERITENTDAYQSYLMGIYFWSRGREDIAKSIPYFERAVEQDRNFALAYAYLADCYYYNAATGGSVASYDESMKKARENVGKALALNEGIAEAHTVVAGIKTLEKDYAGASVEYRRALELNPNFARGHNRYGVFLFHMSDLSGAVNELRRGQELDPASRVSNAALANMLLFERNYDEAIVYAHKAVEIDPDFAPGRLALGEAYLLKRMYNESIAQFNEILKNKAAGKNLQIAKADSAIAYASSGRKAEAQSLLQDLLQNEKDMLPYGFATIYAALGDRDQAMKWLEKEKLSHFRMATLKYDPFLDPLRSDERYNQLLKKPVEDDYE